MIRYETSWSEVEVLKVKYLCNTTVSTQLSVPQTPTSEIIKSHFSPGEGFVPKCCSGMFTGDAGSTCIPPNLGSPNSKHSSRRRITECSDSTAGFPAFQKYNVDVCSRFRLLSILSDDMQMFRPARVTAWLYTIMACHLHVRFAPDGTRETSGCYWMS